MIYIQNLTLQRGTKVLFELANLTINPNQRVGLIGKNGTGKSSLFALLKGELHSDGGDASVPAHWLIASVAQNTPALECSAVDYVLQGDAQLQSLQAAQTDIHTVTLPSSSPAHTMAYALKKQQWQQAWDGVFLNN